jgi:hypothetical protein
MKNVSSCLASMIALVLILIVFGGCDKDGDNHKIKIEGFYLTNANGDHFGHHGPLDDDWLFSATASAEVLALFDFPADLTNTVQVPFTAQMVAYPNPMQYTQSYSLTGALTDSVVLKLVVVNSDLKVLYKTAQKVKGAFGIQIDYSNRTTFPDKASFRVYYSLSALNKPNYLTGYGDIRICTDASGNCF